MNSQTNPDNRQPRRQEPPQVDKTIVEGPDVKTGMHSFETKARIDATTLSATNPYAGKKQVYTPDNLPSGNEPLPLGSGTIVGMLGAGGMARVYKIWNEKLEVFRAVKILIPTQQGDLRNRFETEAKITAKLRHPNIVEVYSVGDWNGLPYLEMELIDGEALDATIARQGKLPPAVCSAIGIFVVRALEYAHGQEFLLYGKNYHGIIHRDLKPANIMISKHGDLRLMDFGIARPTEASLHTVEGNIVGTIQYLSPEQMDGVDIDSRADVYSFGAILYEMLTGTKTFPQDTITNLMKRKIMNDYRHFEDFDFSVPQSLGKISQKCLQLDKENRYADAKALLADLEDAHASLTSDTPERLLKAFLSDPGSISMESGRKMPSFLKLKYVLPALGVVLIACLITVFMLTGPKSNQAPQVAKTPPAPAASQAGAPQPNNVEQPLKPLSGGQGQPAASEPPQPSKPEPSSATAAYQTEKNPPQPHRRPGERASYQTQKSRSGSREGVQERPEPRETAGSPADRLRKTYGSSDFMVIGQTALQRGALDDAIAALENVPSSSPQHDKAFILLLEAYIQADRLRTAKELSLKEQPNDAQYCLLCGEMYQKMGRNKDALEYLQSAITKPSKFRNVRDVRNDALYYTAVTYSEMYKDDPSPDNRGLTLQSWFVVKNMYANNPNNQRYKKAVSELASIK
jgi:serine/threonine protein kinase